MRTKNTLPALAVARMNQGATLQEMGLSAYIGKRLRAEGLIAPRGVRRTGRRGHPATVYGLTDKAHKRVKRAIASGRVTVA